MVAPEDDIAKALKSLEERGFVNYFGLQRFGTGPIGTHTVGKEILRGNFTKAVELLLSAKDNGVSAVPLLVVCHHIFI